MPTNTTQSMPSFLHRVTDRRDGLLSRKRALTFQRKAEMRAAELLELHPHFHGRSQFVELSCVGRRLILSGCLPSYYLKQLAQEAIREIEDVEIENNIVVLGAVGDVASSTDFESHLIGTDSTKKIHR